MQHRFIIALLCLTYSLQSVAVALDMNLSTDNHSYHSFEYLPTLNLKNDVSDHASKQSSTINQFVVGQWVGTKIPTTSPLGIQLGVSYYAPNVLYLDNGSLMQDMRANEHEQFEYAYRLRSQQLLVGGKFLNEAPSKVHPYFAFGLGAAQNMAYTTSTSLAPILPTAPDYPQNTSTSISYMLGAGIDADLNKNWRIGIGYRYSDYGSFGFDHGGVNPSGLPESLSPSHLQVQTVLMQLTYQVS